MPLRLPLFAALLALASACAGAQPAPADPPMPSVIIDQPFVLAPGESGSVTVDGAVIRFDGVSQDSRCPADVACVWAGQAVAHVTVLDADGTVHEAELVLSGGTTGHASLDVAGRARAAGYVVHFLQLSPYPRTNGPRLAPVRGTFLLQRLTR